MRPRRDSRGFRADDLHRRFPLNPGYALHSGRKAGAFHTREREIEMNQPPTSALASAARAVLR